MINLSAADDFLEKLEEKKKVSERSGVKEAIGFMEHTLDKFGEDLRRINDRTRSTGIEESELTKIKKEIKDEVSSILGI